MGGHPKFPLWGGTGGVCYSLNPAATLSHAAATLTLGLALLEQWDLSAFTFTLTLCRWVLRGGGHPKDPPRTPK